MLKELNETFGSLCNVTSTTAKALEDGAKILRLKGTAAKQVCAIEAVKSIVAAKEGVTEEQLKAANELLSIID